MDGDWEVGRLSWHCGWPTKIKFSRSPQNLWLTIISVERTHNQVQPSRKPSLPPYLFAHSSRIFAPRTHTHILFAISPSSLKTHFIIHKSLVCGWLPRPCAHSRIFATINTKSNYNQTQLANYRCACVMCVQFHKLLHTFWQLIKRRTLHVPKAP